MTPKNYYIVVSVFLQSENLRPRVWRCLSLTLALERKAVGRLSCGADAVIGGRPKMVLALIAVVLCASLPPAGGTLLSYVHNFDYINEWIASPSASRESSRACALRALSFDDAHPFAHIVMADSHLWDRRHDDALREANSALALGPNIPGAHGALGLVLHYSGRFEEALRCFDRALALDPFFPDMYLQFQAQAVYQLGRYPEAAGLLKRRILRNPDTEHLARLARRRIWPDGSDRRSARGVAGGAARQSGLFARTSPEGAAV